MWVQIGGHRWSWVKIRDVVGTGQRMCTDPPPRTDQSPTCVYVYILFAYTKLEPFWVTWRLVFLSRPRIGFFLSYQTECSAILIKCRHFSVKSIKLFKAIEVEWAACKKRKYNGWSMQMENSVTRDNCSASLGKPRNAEQLPSWLNFQFATHTIKDSYNLWPVYLLYFSLYHFYEMCIG